MEQDYYQYEDDYPADVYQQNGESGVYYEDDEAVLQQLMQEQHQRMYNEYSILNECVFPTLSQGIQSIWVLLALCLVLRFLSLLKLNSKIIHLMSAVLGIAALWHFYQQSTGYILLLSVIGYVSLASNRTGHGGFLAFVSVIFMLSCEKILVQEMEWNKIRGSVMIVAMKLISIGYDQKNDEIMNLNALGYYGYILNPASIIFGPFISYRNYLQLFHAHALTFSWIFNLGRTAVLSAMCLLWSTCGTTYLIPKLGSNIWIDAFKDANGFRFSTYFVSYTSELTCISMGIGMVHLEETNQNEGNKQNDGKGIACDSVVNDQNGNGGINENVDCSLKQEKKTHKGELLGHCIEWNLPISNPMAVEIPRSLVEVVTNWNLPMHYWLKNYVFKTSRHLGVFPAILLTYFASSLLHGLNFQLSVILLSIGTFAYVENSIRKTLSSAFSACIEARRCKTICKHQYKQGNFWVICVNIAFGFVAVWNLAYLGCLFDNDPDVQEKGYSMTHALRKWAALGYVCHYFMLAVFLVDKLIKDGVFFKMPQWRH